MKNFKTFLSVLFCVISLVSETLGQRIVQFDDLEISLKKYMNTSWLAEREMYLYNDKGRGLKYIPQVGIQFGLPSVTWGTGSIYDMKKDKKMKESTLKSIDKTWELEFNRQLASLYFEYKKWEVKKEQLERELSRLKIDSTIFQIHQEAFDKREMPPLDYYTKLKTFEQQISAVEARREELELLKLTIYQMAYYKVTDIPVYYETEPDCIMMYRGH